MTTRPYRTARGEERRLEDGAMAVAIVGGAEAADPEEQVGHLVCVGRVSERVGERVRWKGEQKRGARKCMLYPPASAASS